MNREGKSTADNTIQHEELGLAVWSTKVNCPINIVRYNEPKAVDRDKKKVEFHSFRQRQPRFRGYFRRNEYMVRKADTVIAYWESLAERGNILHGEQGV